VCDEIDFSFEFNVQFPLFITQLILISIVVAEPDTHRRKGNWVILCFILEEETFYV